MKTKPDFHIRCDPGTEKLTVSISVNNPDLIGKSASFTITQLVHVKKKNPREGMRHDGIRTVFTHSFTIHEQEIKIPIDDQSLLGFDYSGTKIDIELHCKLTVEDGLFFDTKVEKPFSHRLLRKPEVSNDAEWAVEPEDNFDFFSNLRALPFDRGMAHGRDWTRHHHHGGDWVCWHSRFGGSRIGYIHL
jgi:hypothetical protein